MPFPDILPTTLPPTSTAGIGLSRRSAETPQALLHDITSVYLCVPIGDSNHKHLGFVADLWRFRRLRSTRQPSARSGNQTLGLYVETDVFPMTRTQDSVGARGQSPPLRTAALGVLHRPALVGAVIALLVLGGFAAGCGSMPTRGSSSLTTIPRSDQSTTSVPTRPADCWSGSVAVAANSSGSDRPASPVCLDSGATLTVTFDKSAGSWGGQPGAWLSPPVTISGDTSVLKLVTASPNGQTLSAVVEARMPGTSSLNAYFEVSCSSRDTSPCTIPPIAEHTLSVTVVAQQP